jgi:cytochrome aa3-600 menaquinol oxidase subunit 2
MNKKLGLLGSMLTSILLLAGCDWVVFDPNGPVAKTQSDTIIFSMLMLAGVMVVVYVLYIFILVKYRASKTPKDYVPPHIQGSHTLEIIWTAIPIIIVSILGYVTVVSTFEVESKPKGYEDQEPLVIYASSSNWKWHFSYPEQDIETVNYVNIPTDRVVEFRLYSYGPITSFWIPQLGGQKYAMSDMVTKLNFVADNEMSMMGRNSNFSGQGTAHMEFEALSMSNEEFDEWVEQVQANEPELTEKKFDELLDTAYVGRQSYSSTHLEFSPPPEGHNHGAKEAPSNEDPDQENQFDKESEQSENHGNH